MKLLMVSVGGERFAVAADTVVQILDSRLERDLSRDRESGEVVHRGKRYRVVHLKSDPSESEPARLYLLLRAGDGEAMVPVDTADTIQEISPGAIAPIPSFIFGTEHRAFRGVFSDGREPRLLVDVGALL
jgi:chemotaxis signal transduction protein